MQEQPPAPLPPCPRGPDLATVLLPGRKSEHKYIYLVKLKSVLVMVAARSPSCGTDVKQCKRCGIDGAVAAQLKLRVEGLVPCIGPQKVHQ